MQRNLFIIFSISLLTCGQLFAQVDIQKLPWIGYACGYSGEPSEAVQKVGVILESTDYNSLTVLLEKGNPAEQYIAAVTLDYLNKNEIREIKKEEQIQIEKIKESIEYIAYCSGCTVSYYRRSYELFEGKHLEEANRWISKTINKQ
jgi:hypothetical protein